MRRVLLGHEDQQGALKVTLFDLQGASWLFPKIMSESRAPGVEVLACLPAPAGRLGSMKDTHEAAKCQDSSARASRRRFAARAVSRKRGSGSSRQRLNSTSKDVIANMPIA